MKSMQYLKRLLSENFKSSFKVKLAAVAKNESAYLVEWIYHHLYFGFTNIEIFFNRCTDNTEALAQAFAHDSRVNFINADDIFFDGAKAPQIDTYREILKQSYKEAFTHVLFIDIDEFWTPLDLQSSISDIIKNISHADSICFEWYNKVESNIPFSKTIQRTTKAIKARHVKSLIKVQESLPRKMNPHNVRDEGMTHRLADGRLFNTENALNEKMAQLSDSEMNRPIKPAFILHRIYRSQYEYIALIGKPRSLHIEDTPPVKNNRRHGYPLFEDFLEIKFNEQAYENYASYMNLNLRKHQNLTEEGQSFINSEYERVLCLLTKIEPRWHDLIKSTLKNIEIREVVELLKDLK